MEHSNAWLFQECFWILIISVVKKLQLIAARTEITRLRQENDRFRSVLMHLTMEHHNLQMLVVASMQRHSDSTIYPVQSLLTQVTHSSSLILAVLSFFFCDGLFSWFSFLQDLHATRIVIPCGNSGLKRGQVGTY